MALVGEQLEASAVRRILGLLRATKPGAFLKTLHCQELARRTGVMELQLFVVAMLVHRMAGG